MKLSIIIIVAFTSGLIACKKPSSSDPAAYLPAKPEGSGGDNGTKTHQDAKQSVSGDLCQWIESLKKVDNKKSIEIKFHSKSDSSQNDNNYHVSRSVVLSGDCTDPAKIKIEFSTYMQFVYYSESRDVVNRTLSLSFEQNKEVNVEYASSWNADSSDRGVAMTKASAGKIALKKFEVAKDNSLTLSFSGKMNTDCSIKYSGKDRRSNMADQQDNIEVEFEISLIPGGFEKEKGFTVKTTSGYSALENISSFSSYKAPPREDETENRGRCL